jgi:hypothetical protein
MATGIVNEKDLEKTVVPGWTEENHEIGNISECAILTEHELYL